MILSVLRGRGDPLFHPDVLYKKPCCGRDCHHDRSDGYDRCLNDSRRRAFITLRFFYSIILFLKAKAFLLPGWQLHEELIERHVIVLVSSLQSG